MLTPVVDMPSRSSLRASNNGNLSPTDRVAIQRPRVLTPCVGSATDRTEARQVIHCTSDIKVTIAACIALVTIGSIQLVTAILWRSEVL